MLKPSMYYAELRPCRALAVRSTAHAVAAPGAIGRRVLSVVGLSARQLRRRSETGESSRDGVSWTPFFEMTLTQQ